MNCTKCKTKAVIDLPRHNAAFCTPCFTTYVHDQTAYAIKHARMFGPDERILVAVSGGKDSLALWDILLKLGYKADALYVDLGIPGYSKKSREKVEQFTERVAQPHGATLQIHTVQEEEGAGIKELANLVHRPTCATCGTIKRYQFNRTAVEQDYDVMATGHNLDDEAARLLGNVLHWQDEYLDKQSPTLPASVEGFAKNLTEGASKKGLRNVKFYENSTVAGEDFIKEIQAGDVVLVKGSRGVKTEKVIEKLLSNFELEQ